MADHGGGGHGGGILGAAAGPLIVLGAVFFFGALLYNVAHGKLSDGATYQTMPQVGSVQSRIVTVTPNEVTIKIGDCQQIYWNEGYEKVNITSSQPFNKRWKWTVQSKPGTNSVTLRYTVKNIECKLHS